MYKIGYYMTAPVYDEQHIEIQSAYIDFNKYKPEQIFYISKLPTEKGSNQISIYSSEYPENPDDKIERYEKEHKAKRVDELTLFDTMLIYMFNNQARQAFDEEIKYLSTQW